MEFCHADLKLFAVIDEVGALSARAKQRLLDMAVYRKKLDAAVASQLETLKVVLRARNDETRVYYDSVHAKLDELERDFFRYSIPKIVFQPKPDHKTYLFRVREFMRVVWREPVEILRSHEYKNLLEWMNARREVSGRLRRILVETGNHISSVLLEYLWMISDGKKMAEVEKGLGEVKAVIGSLGVEEGSVVIKCFLGVVELFREKRGRPKRSAGKKRRIERTGTAQKEYAAAMAGLFWMITEGILYLEASYGKPVFPEILSRETLSPSTYDTVADDFDKFFKAKVTELVEEADLIQTESEQEAIIEFLSDTRVESPVKNNWCVLE